MAQDKACVTKGCWRLLGKAGHPGFVLCGPCFQQRRRAELAARIAADGDGATAHAAQDCPHGPGSEGKILAMVARARKGLPLSRDGDSRRIA